MGRAMFTIIGAMAELESALISERVTAGMRATEARGRHLGRFATPKRLVGGIEALAASTTLSVRQIHAKIGGRASRGVVGEIVTCARAGHPRSTLPGARESQRPSAHTAEDDTRRPRRARA